VTRTQADADVDRARERPPASAYVGRSHDGVIGVDTHRDTHHAEIARSTGAPIATRLISNDSAGYTQLLDWIFAHAPGPRLVVCIEGTRSYGVGLARAAAAAGLTVIECEQPTRKARPGKGQSDPIDAHLTALQLNAEKLPTPRADGDREALHSCRAPARN
jgi:transposase